MSNYLGCDLLAFDWLHSVDKNHYYVMFLLSQGYCFIQSLLFSYVLQEDFVKFSKKFISVPCQQSGRRGLPSGRSSVSNIRSDDVVFCPDAHLSKHHPSVRRGFPSGPFTISRSFCASLHPSGRLSSPSERHPVINQLPIFFPSSTKGRLVQSSGRRGFPSERAHI
jgi:hypothetical protein